MWKVYIIRRTPSHGITKGSKTCKKKLLFVTGEREVDYWKSEDNLITFVLKINVFILTPLSVLR